MSKEAMKLALEALEQYTNVVASVNNPDAWVTVVDAGKPAREAITALREALAEQKSGIKQVIELYDSPDQPPQRTWVGLTDEEAAATAYKGFDEYWTEDCKGSETEAWAAAGRAIEAKLKEKNNA